MAQGPMASADYGFTPLGDETSDDLPRTFRREKEARAREARERAAQERAAAPSLSTSPDPYTVAAPQIMTPADVQPAVITDTTYPASVRRFDVPFLHLVSFFLKAVFAAIPAIILLGVVLWLLGAIMQLAFPDLVKLKILIGVGS